MIKARARDVNQLINRLVRDDYKLIVVHGPSGVGKSSFLNAGLVPELKKREIEHKKFLPIVLEDYSNDWKEKFRNVCRKIVESDKNSENSESDLNIILGVLKKGIQRPVNQFSSLVILIFDEFDAFFVDCPESERQVFFEFLRDCLGIPSLKVILSLRQDFLHYLLKGERLKGIDLISNNILEDSLSKHNRFYLGKLSPEDAKSVIEKLTAGTPLDLKPELIDKL